MPDDPADVEQRVRNAERQLHDASEHAASENYFEAYELARNAVDDLEAYLEEHDALEGHMTDDK